MPKFGIVRVSLLALGLSVLWAHEGRAQEFGLLESAETIDRGAFKLRANPMVIFGKNGGDDHVGGVVTLGYGFTDRFDLEGGVAIYDGVRFLGFNGEYWIARDPAFDFSVIGGVHWGRADGPFDTRGFDLTLLGTRQATERLEIYGALDFAFESATNPGIDRSFTPVHLIPGIEYRLSRDLDLVAEIGIGLNDEASHYLAAGLAIYFR